MDPVVVARPAGIAPVKAEFLRAKQSAPAPAASAPAATPAESAADAAAAGAPGADGGGGGGGRDGDGNGARKRKRGMNKPNEREHYRAPRTAMCTRFLADHSCEFGDRCKYSHDVQAYLTSGQRPVDLPGECPQVASAGFCRHGVLCRFGLSHIDAEGRNLVAPGVIADSRAHVPGETNYVPASVLAALRRREYAFHKANGAAQLSREATASCVARTGRGWGEAAPEEGAEGAPPATAADFAELAAGAAGAPASARAPEGEQGAGFGCSESALRAEERKLFDIRGKLYLAPLTTVGNLPFRRLAVALGADVTCSEMALSLKLLQGDPHEWSLLRRHSSEAFFGVQIAGGATDIVARACEAISREAHVDFVDLNMGCPIDSICNKGMGAMLVGRPTRVGELVRAAATVLAPAHLTVKLRTGVEDRVPMAHKIVPLLATWGASACTLHGRSRQQRYSRTADWNYIGQCAAASSVPLIGNGDIFSYEDLDAALRTGELATVMVARGALIKPWIFTELKERRHWDITAGERFEQMKQFVRNGLEHWGSDELGVNRTRTFLLEWLSFTHRYVPIGLLDVLPARINERPPSYYGRSDLETLLASPAADDWVKLSEMLLGPVPTGYRFTPKHKANASGPMVAEG
ncbi:hypothetical protein KFE25_003879 [Diacronema lutheri]|uniref:tRNA-dihydrouridine(47) synthase [NAD(P)(+)] n=3 Tax=Diacronema lutheri TaxID=2081491 RepID=A0A8J5XDI9_DIALT|nr:hypothetical protein KFE25_003879 [Diacronema lutheri]